MYDEFKSAARGELSEQNHSSAKPTLTVDVEKYQSMLDGSGLSDTEKEQVLQALWTIIVNLVELGFEVHPLQEVCGKSTESDVERCINSPDEVRSEDASSDDPPIDSTP